MNTLETGGILMGNFALKLGEHPAASTVIVTSSAGSAVGIQEITHAPWAWEDKNRSLVSRSVATPVEGFFRLAPSLWVNLAAEGTAGLQDTLGLVGRLKLGIGTEHARLSGHAGMTLHNLYERTMVRGAEFCYGNIRRPGIAFVANYEQADTATEGDVSLVTVGARYTLPWLSYQH